MKWFVQIIFIVVACVTLVPFSSHAQFTSLSQEFNISLEPLMPLPGEPVKVFISSNTYDLNSFEITWKVDNQIVVSNLGVVSVNVTTPVDRSKSHYVTALIKTDGRTVEKSVYVQGRSVAILEQAPNVSVFPGYRGRRVPSTEEDLKIVAIPDESFSDYVNFTWDKNYIEGLPDLSGTKRDFFVIPATIFNDIETVGLTLEDLKTRRKVRMYRDISYTPQIVEFYGFTSQNNPDFYHVLPNSYEIQKNKILTSILAYPFGYNKTFLKTPELTWYINNEEITAYTNKIVLPLKNDNSESGGTVDLQVTVSPTSTFSQETQKTISVSY